MGLWNWIVDTVSKHDNEATETGQATAVAEVVAEDATMATTKPDESVEQPTVEPTEPSWWAPEGASLTQPVPMVRPELSAEALALENTLVSQFDGHDLELPPLPRVPEKVLRRLQDATCDFARVADDIAEDQVIAAAVIRMANSPFYRGVEKVTALKPAITRLGAKALRSLMLNQSMRAVSAGGKEGDQILAELIWRRSLASAAILRGLSAFTNVNEEEAFLLGLLHDIGNVIVLREVRKQHRHVGYQFDIATFEYLCFECHQEFGELIAKAWSLPPDLQALIADHHRHPEEDDPRRVERLLIQLTDMICGLLDYAPAAAYDLCATRTVNDLGLAGREDFMTYLDRLPADVEESINCL